MTILVAVKKNDRVYLGADRITTFGNEYSTDLVNGSKIIKLKHAYLATSGYTLLDNVIEHLFSLNHKMMENTFRNRAEVFTFFLELYAELKKNYTLADVGKDTYANMYNVFLLVTPKNIYTVANNLAVHEHERFAAKGAGSDYSLGCLYGVYDLIEDAFEITRLALEAACHFSIYCKEPLDIIFVDAKHFGSTNGGYKQHTTLKTMRERQGTRDLVAIDRGSVVAGGILRDYSLRLMVRQPPKRHATNRRMRLSKPDPLSELPDPSSRLLDPLSGLVDLSSRLPHPPGGLLHPPRFPDRGRGQERPGARRNERFALPLAGSLAQAPCFMGRRNQNVLPLPGSLSTPIVPPCCSMIALQMGRPSPVPPLAPASLSSTCWKRSKIRR